MFETWEELENSIVNCNKCKLCKTRQNIVFVFNDNGNFLFKINQKGSKNLRLKLDELVDMFDEIQNY